MRKEGENKGKKKKQIKKAKSLLLILENAQGNRSKNGGSS
jgi:hypothetical protein